MEMMLELSFIKEKDSAVPVRIQQLMKPMPKGLHLDVKKAAREPGSAGLFVTGHLSGLSIMNEGLACDHLIAKD
jgi:hypothetical protein